MNPTAPKLPKDNSSFTVQTVCSPTFDQGRHNHIEYELVLFTNGSGIVNIGGYEGEFKDGDIYFLGSNLPHAFKTNTSKPVAAVIIQFRDIFLGSHFINIPECKIIKELLNIGALGLQLTENTRNILFPLIEALQTAVGMKRIILLLQCLELMAATKNYNILNKKKAVRVMIRNRDAIDMVKDFTLATFHNHISLSQAAAVACMSIPSFCHYFKLCTSRTYFNYLNEVRISNACRQLLETNKTVTEICYESGYSTIPHFHRQFLRLTKITPLQYRKKIIFL